MNRRNGVILALDVTDASRAASIAAATKDCIDAVKIGYPLVLAAGPEMITALSKTALIICDFKVADIPSTNELIVREAVRRGASAVIVHGLTGRDSVAACVNAAKPAEIFVVTEMSHPGAEEFMAANAERMARIAKELGAAGIVAPATRPERLRVLHDIVHPLQVLAPGVGAQGGDVAAVLANGATADGTGLVISSSRAVLYAGSGSDYAEAARAAALKLRDEINLCRKIK